MVKNIVKLGGGGGLGSRVVALRKQDGVYVCNDEWKYLKGSLYNAESLYLSVIEDNSNINVVVLEGKIEDDVVSFMGYYTDEANNNHVFILTEGDVRNTVKVEYSIKPQGTGGNGGSVDLSNYYNKEETEEKIDEKIQNKADKSELFSGNYDDLSNKPEIPDVSNKVDRDELDKYYTKSTVDSKLETLNNDVQGQIDGLNTAVEALTNGTSTEEIDSVMELVNYVNEHGTEVQGMKDEIAEHSEKINQLDENYSTMNTDKVLFDMNSENLTNPDEIANYVYGTLVGTGYQGDLTSLLEGLIESDSDTRQWTYDNFTNGKANQAIADGNGNNIANTYATKSELFSKDYNDLINKPEIPSIEGLATEQYVNDQIGLIEIPDVSNKADKSELFSGDYNDLTNKPEIPSIDGLASEQYVQDQIGLIEIPDISGKADKSELGNYYTKEESNQLLEEKANKSELFSGSYDDLTNKPEIPSTEGLATESYVQGEVEAINTSLNNMYTKEETYNKAEIEQLINNAITAALTADYTVETE